MIQFALSIAPLEDVNLSQAICVQCSDVICLIPIKCKDSYRYNIYDPYMVI